LLRKSKPNRTQDQRGEHQEHGDVEAGERGGVDRRPSREHRAAAEDQPDLIALPDRPDGVDGDAPLDVLTCHIRQQHRHSQVEAVHDGEADQEHAEKQPPDET
jgi:hypothetical protein